MFDKLNRFFGVLGVLLYCAFMVGFVIYVTAEAIERDSQPWLVFLLSAAVPTFVIRRGLVRFFSMRRARKRLRQMSQNFDRAKAWCDNPNSGFLTLAVAESFRLKPPHLQIKHLAIKRRRAISGFLKLFFLLLAGLSTWQFLTEPSAINALTLLFPVAVLAVIWRTRLPAEIQANDNGISIDAGRRIHWADVQSIRLVALPQIYGLNMMEIIWDRNEFRKFSLNALQDGGVRLIQTHYRCEGRTMAEAYAILNSWWSYRGERDEFPSRLEAIRLSYENRIEQWRRKMAADGREPDQQMEAILASARKGDEQMLLMEFVRRDFESELGRLL
ncbi:MAG TPA: hypothetical protein VFV64_15620 [Permianibacter sp.]|nr:hypothetical protein [Permianibacter sp.]